MVVLEPEELSPVVTSAQRKSASEVTRRGTGPLLEINKDMSCFILVEFAIGIYQ